VISRSNWLCAMSVLGAKRGHHDGELGLGQSCALRTASCSEIALSSWNFAFLRRTELRCVWRVPSESTANNESN